MFAEKNLYENPFDELVATVAFSGVIDTSRVPEGLSGELTTSGRFPKAWRVVDGERYLYKAGAPNSNDSVPNMLENVAKPVSRLVNKGLALHNSPCHRARS